tara:strand:- start:2451 stop:2636 length:186 start_codon:yes stop_codon:yes gene_type:complete
MKKEVIEKRKDELQKQHDDLVAKISEGRQAISNMEVSAITIKGAIQQCNWTLDEVKKEKDK